MQGLIRAMALATALALEGYSVAYLAQDDLGTTIRKALAAILGGRDLTAQFPDQTNVQLAGALPIAAGVR
jgi:hypothetical protein